MLILPELLLGALVLLGAFLTLVLLEELEALAEELLVVGLEDEVLAVDCGLDVALLELWVLVEELLPLGVERTVLLVGVL